jgi:hypothetical protein
MKEQNVPRDPRLQLFSNVSSLVTSVFDLDHLLELIIESVTVVIKLTIARGQKS